MSLKKIDIAIIRTKIINFKLENNYKIIRTKTIFDVIRNNNIDRDILEKS